MNVSSTANTFAQQTINNTHRTEGAAEGNKPDGDADKDTIAGVATTSQPVTVSSGGSTIGSHINVTA